MIRHSNLAAAYEASILSDCTSNKRRRVKVGGAHLFVRPGTRPFAKRICAKAERRLAKVDVATRLGETMTIDPVIPEVFMDLLAIEAACGEGFALSHLANDNWAEPPPPVVMTRKQALVAFARAA